MPLTVGGDDEYHDLTPEEKNTIEKKLRAEARILMKSGRKKQRNMLLNQAAEISRRKSKRADHH